MRLTRMPAVALTAMAMIAAPASAKTITMHYYFKQVSVRFTNAAGHAQNRHTRPVAGDMGDLVILAYVGNGNHHAKRWTASAHVGCVFRSSKRATCDAQFAIGGSMLLLNRIKINFGANSQRLTINGGTGVFRRAHGTLTAVTIQHTKNSDVTIRVRI
jgi:hypothetical protein